MSTCCDTPADPVIPIGADYQVGYEGAHTDVGGVETYLNAGPVTYALKDSDGATIAGGTGSLTYDGAGTGDYYGTIDADVTVLLTEDASYYIEITYTDGSGNDDFRRVKRVAGYRGET